MLNFSYFIFLSFFLKTNIIKYKIAAHINNITKNISLVSVNENETNIKNSILITKGKYSHYINNNIFVNSTISNYSYSDSNNLSNIIKKNLLIGIIQNYIWKDIAPFFNSFKKSQFNNCECVMFVSKLSKRTIKRIKSIGVIIKEFPYKLKDLNIMNLRWKIYEDFLVNNPSKYNIVFATDVRDVFFQKDFFEFYKDFKPFLGVALEDGNLSETFNKNWLTNFYGEDLEKIIEHERIICAGTIWGTSDKFLEFLRIMRKNLNFHPNLIDQAAVNYLIYHDKMFNNDLIKSGNENGPVMTIGLTKNENINLDSENNILNGKGEIAAVIHQYDRKNNIMKIVKNRFCPELMKLEINKEIYKDIHYIYFFISFVIILICSLIRYRKLIF